MKIDKILYRAEVDALGGRNGTAVSTDRHLDLKLTMPKEMGGGGGDGTNPEQLFAAGYSACFLTALHLAARTQKMTLPPETKIHSTVGVGPVSASPGNAEARYEIEVELQISIPGLDKSTVESLIAAADQVCPYSNAIRGNVAVKLTNGTDVSLAA